ncbi:MAG: hypothetical protein RMK74_04045 [Myxococcales bacterium]|nr:hypothetical protein [Myxococcales bacterium]
MARSAHRALRALLLCVAGLAAPIGEISTADAQQNPLIARGRQQLDDLEFEEALQTLSAALVRAGNTDEDRAEIYRLLAFTYFALSRPEEATGAYRALLALRPDYVPGNEVAPRIREFFGRVRAQWEADGRPGLPPPAPVTIAHRSPPQAERNTPVTLTASLEDPSRRVARLVLAYRQGTSDVFRRVDATLRGAGYVATLPAEAVRPPLVEYYFEALDASGLPIASRGDVAAPLRIAVPAPGGSVFGKWWFWVGAAVVVGGAVTAGVLLAGGEQAAGQGTFVVTLTE